MRISDESGVDAPITRAKRLLQEALEELDRFEGELEGKALVQAAIDALAGDGSTPREPFESFQNPLN